MVCYFNFYTFFIIIRVCDICQLTCDNEMELEAHEETHFSTALIYYCSLCSSLFVDKQDMKNHMKEHFRADDNSPQLALDFVKLVEDEQIE